MIQSHRSALRWMALVALLTTDAAVSGAEPASKPFDVVIRDATVYDGSGHVPYRGDLAIRGDRIVYVGPHAPGTGREEVRADGKAIAPGFVNMLAHPEVSLLVDARAPSDLKQGVTLEVIGEDSMGPISPEMRASELKRQTDIKYDIDWTTLGGYLDRLAKRGIAPNVASYVGAGTVRVNVLGERDVQPTPEELAKMRTLVREAMEQGAMGVTTALIYAHNAYAKTPELIALASESARCGGIYSAHMRSEGDCLLEAIDETVEIARASGAPAEIFHFKVTPQKNWGMLDRAIARVEAARAAGTRITADMYVYPAGATGFDAAMPPWVKDGGLEAWIERLKDPAIRARVLAEMRDPKPDWENLAAGAGPAGTLLLGFGNPKLKPLTGKTLADVAATRGTSPEDTIIDLVIEDGTRVEVAYFLMSEDNIRREVALPWMSFDSDAEASAPEGVFLLSSTHPRAYGNFARVLAKYVRKEHALTLEAAIHQLSALPASVLSIPDRGLLKAGNYADVVLFDPKAVQDHATFDKPMQFATGVDTVWVNGVAALRKGEFTGAPSGRIVRGRAWTGHRGGGCRASSRDWTWSP